MAAALYILFKRASNGMVEQKCDTLVPLSTHHAYKERWWKDQ